MKKGLVLLLFFLIVKLSHAQEVVEPDGDKLLWVGLALLLILAFFILSGKKKGTGTKTKMPFSLRKKVQLKLEKDSLYYPDNLTLTVNNQGKEDIDLDKPLLIFDNFWLKRKFKLKGMENRSFYPLYLEKGKTHTLQIDLNRFYSHDKSLKKFPKAKIVVSEVKGKKLGSKSVYLRKTLFKY